MIKPAPLRPGDTVAVVAPAGPIDAENLARGCEHLRALGYRPVYLDSILERDRYFAGSLARRVDELHGWFRDPQVRAIVCARGGYGCNYLLPVLDYELIRRNPKIFVGLSDITTLHLALLDRAGLVTFHGPMAAAHFAREGGVDLASWHSAVSGEANWSIDAGKTIKPGTAEGALYGGCLSLIVQSLGTPWAPHTDGCILFLEDVNEPAYRLDRMLMHLKLAGKLAGVRGVVFSRSLTKQGEPFDAETLIRSVLADLDVPIAYGLSSGHIDPSATVPLGVRVRLHCTNSNAELRILEAATAEAQ